MNSAKPIGESRFPTLLRLQVWLGDRNDIAMQAVPQARLTSSLLCEISSELRGDAAQRNQLFHAGIGVLRQCAHIRYWYALGSHDVCVCLSACESRFEVCRKKCLARGPGLVLCVCANTRSTPSIKTIVENKLSMFYHVDYTVF